uniref:HAUS augmin-like complex subunit 3 N-terminal domain-containing protein n=1 Tax=Catharus ustulatus TaxID=91951 RepID=A0A8C3UUZ2_CATUS
MGSEDFMATLRLIHPHADTLCEKEFEWLFDCPETKQFLEWFCSMLGEENVLSPAEVEAYEALVAAGKPILEGDALEEALKMCCQVLQLPGSIADEGLPQEALQQLQELKHCYDCQLWRFRKLLAWKEKLQQEQKYLEKGEKVVKQEVRMAHMDLKAKIFKTRSVLSQVSKAAKQVSECHGNMGMSQLPILLCQTDLDPYLKQEQQATDAFESFIQQVLPKSVQAPAVWKASAQGESSLEEGLEAETQMDSYCEIPEERRGAPYQECMKTPSGVAPASWEMLVQGSKAELLVEGGNERDAAALQRRLHTLRFNIAQTLTHQLPPLLKAEACRLRLPILHEYFSLEVACLQNTARRQEEVAAWLLSQHSRLDLLELQLKRERKELERMAAWLVRTKTVMRESQTRLQEQQNYFRDARLSQKGHPRKLIDPKDLTLMQQLVIMQDDLYEKLEDLLRDLETKRRSLEDPMLQAERNLYVYFYKDRLIEMVEELEKQASASSKGPLRKLPYIKE